MLDTNTVSYLIRNQSAGLKAKLLATPVEQICISVITEAELLHGVARKPEAKHLPAVVNAFLNQVHVLDFDSAAAQSYAALRVSLAKQGKSLSAMDMLIAAQAMSAGATLVSSDKAFTHINKVVTVVDWHATEA